jgi:hypothetical protein
MERSKKEEMTTNKKNSIFLFLFICLIFIQIKGENAYSQSPTNLSVNGGIMFGVNALSSNYYDVYRNDVPIEDKSYQNKVGYSATAFFKINFKHIFLQTELATNRYNRNFSFTYTDEDSPKPIENDVYIKSYSVKTAALLGYYLVEKTPYRINLFVGPSIRYIYKSNYKIKNTADFTDRDPQYGYTGIVGFSLSIGLAYFDIRYEFNLPNSDIHFSDIPDVPESMKGVFIHKNENILNFSCGLMF